MIRCSSGSMFPLVAIYNDLGLSPFVDLFKQNYFIRYLEG
jgi:hypothetical protein